MKKTIITIMLAIVSMATFAQNEPGTLTIYPRVGVNFSKFADSGIGYFDGQSIAYTESEFKPGLVLGVEGEYQLSDLFAINGCALYSQQGEQYDLPSDSEEYDKVNFYSIHLSDSELSEFEDFFDKFPVRISFSVYTSFLATSGGEKFNTVL